MQVLRHDIRNEEQRLHFRLALTILAPEKAEQGCTAGMGSKIAKRLGVSNTTQAWADSVSGRDSIDKAHADRMKDDGDFKDGDTVWCRHGKGTLISLAEDKSCTVRINMGSTLHISEFKPIGTGENARGQ